MMKGTQVYLAVRAVLSPSDIFYERRFLSSPNELMQRNLQKDTEYDQICGHWVFRQ